MKADAWVWAVQRLEGLEGVEDGCEGHLVEPSLRLHSPNVQLMRLKKKLQIHIETYSSLQRLNFRGSPCASLRSTGRRSPDTETAFGERWIAGPLCRSDLSASKAIATPNPTRISHGQGSFGLSIGCERDARLLRMSYTFSHLFKGFSSDHHGSGLRILPV